MDDLTRLRDAFETLGITPDEILATDSYSSELGLVVRLRDAAARLFEAEQSLVTPSTPIGTEINHPNWVTRFWLIGHKRQILEFLAESEDGRVLAVRYDEGWREVKRPDPIPVEEGQWRAMPVQVVRIFDTVSTAGVVTSDGSNQVRTISEIESWPVIPPPENTDD